MIRKLAILGPVNGRVHGAQAVTNAVFERVREQGHLEVEVLDTNFSGASAWSRLANRFTSVVAHLRVVRHERPSAIYYVPSSGWGLVFELVVLLAARRRGVTDWFVHHHSMRYLEDPGLWRLRIVRRVCASRTTEIALCECMTSRLERGSTRPRETLVVSNVGWFTPTHGNGSPREAGSTRVAYISNLSREKGSLAVLELLRRGLFEVGGSMSLVVAGPCDDEAAVELRDELQRPDSHDAVYLGPVDASTRDEVFRRVDVVLLPTRYRPEAEPLVLLEAASAGVVPIAYDRGCIGEFVRILGSGWALLASEDRLATLLRDISDGSTRLPPREDVAAAFARMHEVREGEARRLIERLAGALDA